MNKNAIYIQGFGHTKDEAKLLIFHATGNVEVFHSYSNAAIGCLSGWVVEGYPLVSKEEAEQLWEHYRLSNKPFDELFLPLCGIKKPRHVEAVRIGS